MHRFALLSAASLLFLASPACDSDECATVGNICTWAGTNHAGFNGDDESLSDARFYWPIDMKITSTGETYILDWNNHKVRHLDAKGNLHTVIGTDFVGDGDYATADLMQPGVKGTEINLNHPTQILERKDGSLVLVSWHNHKLRHYDPETGMVYVMGGRGAGFVGDGGPLADPMLRFNQPAGGTTDPDGNIFLVDQRNQRIRKISADLQMVSTIAGNGMPGYSGDGGDPLAAQFNFPMGSNPPPAGTMAIDKDGNLYISDTLNHVIRKLSADYKKIETLAGTGESGFGGDDGPANKAQLNNPRDLEIGPDGRLFVADEYNHRVRAIDLGAGTITTIAGTGDAEFSGDNGPATRAALNRPTGLEFDDAGLLYIADSHNNRIRTVTLR